MLSKYGNCSRQLKIKNKLKIGCRVFTNKVGENSPYFVGVFNKTIIPLALVGYVQDHIAYQVEQVQNE